MSTDHHSSSEHSFRGSWRWPRKYEQWVKSHLEEVQGRTANVFAGLSPLATDRFDLRTPVELIENLQEDEYTTLEDAGEYLSGFIVGNPQMDVIEALYEASDPTDHPAAKYIETASTVKADLLNGHVPAADDSYAAVICDPPWKNLSEKHHLIAELSRITRPGGKIIFNGYWIPTGSLPLTISDVQYRIDRDRYSGGNPNLSWFIVYRVHDSVDTARHLGSTLGHNYEHTPSVNSFKQAIRARKVFELTHIHDLPSDGFENDIVDPYSEYSCPQCGSQQLDPLIQEHEEQPPDDLYECVECGFRSYQHELSCDSAPGSQPPEQQTLLAN